MIDAEGVAMELGSMAESPRSARFGWRLGFGRAARSAGGRMKYIYEYRNAEIARKLVDEIHRSRPGRGR